MLYTEQKNINPADIDVDAFMSHLVNDSFASLIEEARRDYTLWRSVGYYTESYLADKIFELLDVIVGKQKDALDPIERNQVLLICADANHTSAEKSKRLSRFAELEKDIDWASVSKRAAILAKALHRSAVVATIVVGDRMWEEYQIITRKFKVTDQNTIAQTALYVNSVNASLLLLNRALDHAMYLKMTDKPAIMLTRGHIKSAFPKIELFDEVVDSAVECLKYVGIFIAVVQKTISEQRNPYMLNDFTQDLVLMFNLIEKKGGPLTEKQVRDGVAEYSRDQELRERTVIWMQTYLTFDYIQKQLERPFAKKISDALKDGNLGRGKIIKLLKDNVSKSSRRTKVEAAFILDEIIKNTSGVTIAGVPVSTVRSYIVFTGDASDEVDHAKTAQLLRDVKLLPEDKVFTNKDQLQLKELAGIMRLTQSFSQSLTK